MRERGSGTVLAIGLLAVTVVAAMAVVSATQIVIARARAVTAADAAALAAAPMTFPPVAQGESPVAVASDMALSNGARLVRCECVVLANFDTRAVEVEVGIPVDLILIGPRLVRATSRAEFVP